MRVFAVAVFGLCVAMAAHSQETRAYRSIAVDVRGRCSYRKHQLHTAALIDVELAVPGEIRRNSDGRELKLSLSYE